MVKTPWYDEEIPFMESAEKKKKKVIKDHATIGIVMTTDGSFGEFTRGEITSTFDNFLQWLQ